MAPPSLYILYNADASVMGKLSYGYRKLTSKDPDKPACAACDITHGGLRLDETAQWKSVKADFVKSGAVKEVKQLHRDELDTETKAFVQSQSLQYPMVLAQREAGELRVVMDEKQLAGFKGDSHAFLQILKERLAVVEET
ncbi:MAG: hypothetical protein Q9218_002350 [Villophora microphyllina]